MRPQPLTSLAQPELLYSSLFAALPGNSLLIKTDEPRYTILAATPQYLEDTGTTNEILIGKGLFEVFPGNPDDPADTGQKDLRSSLAQVLNNKQPHALPVQRYDIKDKDGSFTEHYWRVDNRPVFDQEGEVAYIIHSAVNITDQVKSGKLQARMKEMELAHQVIKTQEANLRNMVLSAPIGICVMEAPGLVSQIANDRFVEIAGKPVNEIVGQFYWDTFSLARPYYEAALNKVVTEGVTFQAEEVEVPLMRHGKKENVFVSFVYEPLKNEAGTVTKVAVWVIDNTKQVVERRKVEESESNLRSTILQSPVAMCILLGPQFVVEIANARMYELWGRGPDIMEGKPIFEGIPEAAQKGLEELLLHVYTTGETYSGKERPLTLPRKGTAETVYVDFVYEPFREGDGNITGVIAVTINVTDQVQARKKMQQNEADLQRRVEERTADLAQQKAFIASILDASLSGIYALMAVRDINGNIIDFLYLFANNNTARLVNRSPEEIIGASMLQLIPENKTNGFFDLFCRILQTGETVHDVTHFVTHDFEGWFDYVIVPAGEDTLVVTTQDITEQKLASLKIEEQRNLLDSILTNSSNGISVSKVVRGKDGSVVDANTILANDAAIKFIGLPKDIYLTKRATEIEPNIVSSAYYQMCIKTLETGEPFVTQYFTESTGRWLELTVSKLDNDHLIHIFTDVTPIKETQLQLEKSVEELKRSNQNLEEFAYAASHDLKEPMRKIYLFSDRLRESLQHKLLEEEKNFFDRILQATRRMNTLIDDLLLYSQVSRDISLDEMVDLNKKVKLVLEDLDLEIEQKKAVIHVGQLPTIYGHRRQLQQLFQNLIGNAIKYKKPGVPPTVHIKSRLVNSSDYERFIIKKAPNQQYHLIEVSDNGIGFDPQDAERIFNVFTRLHGNAEYIGTGVGLSIVRRVAENHGGYIWAESQPNVGSTFKVLLPAEGRPINFPATP